MNGSVYLVLENCATTKNTDNITLLFFYANDCIYVGNNNNNDKKVYSLEDIVIEKFNKNIATEEIII